MSFIATIKFKLKKYRLRKKYPNVEISGNSILEYTELIDFKGTCYIGPGAYWTAKGGITIGNNVIFGPKTVLWTYNHNYKSDISIPYGGDDIAKEIKIKDNVWVGLNALILPGVTVEEGVVIGAHSVVTKDIPKYAIVGGNPAKIIGYRDADLYEKLKKEKRNYLDIKFNI